MCSPIESMKRVIASLFLVACAFAGDPEWPGFRGPSSNPSAINSDLPDTWSKTSNIEWTATLPGLGWSSPIVAGRYIFLTTVTTDGKAKQPQVGTTYSNDYIAELSKQGFKDKEVEDRSERARFRIPQRSQPALFPLFHRSLLRQDQLDTRIPFRSPSRGPSPQEQLLLGNPCHRRQARLRLHQ
jgi:hypothetical protein